MLNTEIAREAIQAKQLAQTEKNVSKLILKKKISLIGLQIFKKCHKVCVGSFTPM